MDRDTRVRWTDDRIDDLATLVHSNDQRLDRNVELVDAHERDLKNMARTGDRRKAQRFELWIAMLTTILTVVLTNIISIIIILSHVGH